MSDHVEEFPPKVEQILSHLEHSTLNNYDVGFKFLSSHPTVQRVSFKLHLKNYVCELKLLTY